MAAFCESPSMMESLAELFDKIMEEGHQFLLMSYGLQDTGGATELEEMLDSLSDPLEVLGGDSSLSVDHPWWPQLERQSCLRMVHLRIGLFPTGVNSSTRWYPFRRRGSHFPRWAQTKVQYFRPFYHPRLIWFHRSPLWVLLPYLLETWTTWSGQTCCSYH